LTGGASDKFEIVGNQLVVKQGAVLDYEASSTFDLTITATDSHGAAYSQAMQVCLSNVVETGTKGNDIMTGGHGADILQGGAGNDIYSVNAIGDVVVELASQGNDTVQTTLASYTLGSNLEHLTYTGSESFTGTGNSLANQIGGGAGDDTLYGAAGNDTISGGSGHDNLYGDAGNDKIFGGDDADSIFGGDGGDILQGDAGDDRIDGGIGYDTLYGNDGNDYLNGGRDQDQMRGGTGDDTYVVDNAADVVTECANEGRDTVVTSLAYTLGANVENLTLTGVTNIKGTGNSLANVIIGNDGNNTLLGDLGDDTLDGGKGKDRLVGGDGSDTYLFGRGSGQDTIDNYHTDHGHDVLQFKEGVGALDLWMSQNGEDLIINVIGTGDSARLVGWYNGQQLDELQLSDGSHLDAGSVQQVVDAMAHAAVAAPSSLDALQGAVHDSVVTAIAATWH
jgi:Ca2+-binding RTX toxin-like protein